MAVYSPEIAGAKQNLEKLGENVYPGRLLVVGFFGSIAIQAYVVEGRSDDSKNRLLVGQDGIVSTETFDKSRPPKHPELTIYDAMRRVGPKYIVSNGDQTSTAIQHVRSGLTFETAMEARDYEDDEPNYTPRISAYTDIPLYMEGGSRDDASFAISVLRKSSRSDRTMRRTWTDSDLEPVDGIGYCTHTYAGDAPKGVPIPSFTEAPFPVPVPGNAVEALGMLWETLDPTNVVAVAAKAINIDNGHSITAIKNTHVDGIFIMANDMAAFELVV